MAKKRTHAPAADRSASAEAQLARLAEANAGLQADIARRFEAATEPDLLAAVLNQLPDFVYAKDTKGRFIVANDAVARDVGLTRGAEVVGKTDFDLLPAVIAQGIFETEQQLIVSGSQIINAEEMRLDASGEARWRLTTRIPMRDARGEVAGLIGVARDITDRKRAEKEAHAQQILLRAVVDQVQDFLFVTDADGRFLVANRAVAADLGLMPEDMLGKTSFDILPAEIAGKFIADDRRVMATNEPMIDVEEPIVDGTGARKWLSTSKVPLRNDRNETIGIIGVARDVTERKRAQDQIHFMAHHDALTGLPNRSLLMDRLAQALLQAQRNAGRVTVMFLDLDNFKQVNDSQGHDAGDTLLKTVAERMVSCVRATDTVVRLGGDEFVILLIDDARSPSAAATVAGKIRAAIAEPIPIDGQMFHVTSSIGLAAFPENGSNAEALLMSADIAMYRAKEKGRDNIQIYAAEMHAEANDRRLLQEGSADRAGAQPVRPGLPTAGRSAIRAHFRRGSPCALAPSRARRRSAFEVHPDSGR